MVESTGARMFGLEESELIERRKYVARVRREIEVRTVPPLVTCFHVPFSIRSLFSVSVHLPAWACFYFGRCPRFYLLSTSSRFACGCDRTTTMLISLFRK
jgi:hypothetical protein